MKTRLLFTLSALLGWTALAQNPTPIANLSRTNLATGTNLMAVVTHPGATNGTRGITLSNLLHSLTNLSTWPISGSAASVTNAIGTVKTNGVTVGSASTATSLDFVTGSNTVIRMTNAAGAVTVEINASATGGGASSNYTTLASGSMTVGTVIASNAVRTGQIDVSTNANASNLRATNSATFDGTAFFPSGASLINSNSGFRRRVALWTSTQALGAAVNVDDSEIEQLDGISLTATVQQQFNDGVTSRTALTNYIAGVSNYTDIASSNRVRIVAGTGGITVSQAGASGVQTFTVNDDDVGATNIQTLAAGSITTGVIIATNEPGFTGDAVYWEDFSFPNTTLAGMTGRKPKKGIVTYMISGVASNNIMITNGVMKFPSGLAVDQNAGYLTITNTGALYALPNAVWMKLRMTNNTAFAGNFTDVPAIVWEPDHNIDGNSLHFYCSTGRLVGQSGGVTFLNEPVSLPLGSEFLYGVTIVSNTAYIQWGQETYIGTHSSISAQFGTCKTVTWELLGSGTNQYQIEITEAGAGHAHPAIHQLAGRALTIGTNGTITTAQISGTNFVGTLALPNVTTNRLLLTGGGSNVQAAAVGPGLSVSAGALLLSQTLTNIAGTGALTNLYSPTLSNATIKPLVIGVGTAAGATNTTGQIRGIAAGANITLSENGSNVVITAAGASATLFSAGNTNATDLAIVHEGTNTTGGIKTIRAGSNVTITESGGTNLVISSTGGGGASNYTTIAAGSLTVDRVTMTNGFRFIATNLAVAGTNLVADGAASSYFTNMIASSGGLGLTNIVFTNLLDGQTITADIWTTNGTDVQICTAPGIIAPSAWYFDGAIATVNSNGFSRIQVSRFGGLTNISVQTPTMGLANNGVVLFITNFAARTILVTLDPKLTNLVSQNHSFTNLTIQNLAGTGAVTNLFSPTLSNGTIIPLVVGSGTASGATNTTGQIRGLAAGANITLTPNGSNVVIASTGGSQTPWTSDIDAARFKLTNEVFKPVNVRWFGALGDDSTDDTVAFNAAFTAAGSTNVVYVPSGKYRVGPLIYNGPGLYGDGMTSEIKQKYFTNGTVLLTATNTGTMVANISLVGSNSTTTWANGTATATYTGAVVTAMGPAEIINVSVAGFHLGMRVTGLNDPASRAGLGRIDGAAITNCTTGIQFGADDNSAEYVLLTGSQIRDCQFGINNWNGGNIFILDNLIVDCDSWGYIQTATSSTEKGNSTIRGNVFNHCSGVRFEKWSTAVFENNTMQATANAQFNSCTNVTFRYNTFSGNVFFNFSSVRGINVTGNRTTSGTYTFTGFTGFDQVWVSENLTNGIPDRQLQPPIEVGAGGAAFVGTNATVGGVIYKAVQIPAYTNLNTTIGTFTNCFQYIVPGNTLTNNGDSIITTWRGTMLAGTNSLKLWHGFDNVMQTGSFTNGFSAWEAGMQITRTGNNAAEAYGWFDYGQIQGSTTVGTRAGYQTNWSLTLATNGAPATNVLQIGSNRAGCFSNNFMRVFYEPASK
jgi:hypothetical protein